MEIHVDFSKLRTSWTKDIVQVLDVVDSVETIEKYKRKEVEIDEGILKSFLGIKSLNDPTPSYWIEIQKYPAEKKIFSLLALLFTDGEIVKLFALLFAKGKMKGVFINWSGNEVLTNIREALVVSGAIDSTDRRVRQVPYDFSIAFHNPEVGKLFKQVLEDRLSRLIGEPVSEDDFFRICEENKFHRALSLKPLQFRNWLEGKPFEASYYINRLTIRRFFCIEEVELDFKEAKEVYFLGENGDGKTLLLMALYMAFNGNYISNETTKKATGSALDILDKDFSLKGFDELGNAYQRANAIYLDKLYAYGTHRGIYSADHPEKYGFMSLFDNNQSMTSPVQWLKDLRLDEIQQPVEELHEIFYELLERNVQTVMEGSEVYFLEKGYKLTLEQLSEGYRSILIFVCDLLARLSEGREKFDLSVLQTNAVVLVDEIDQHLHPRWQRVIVKKLRRIFPNIQFFFTTHSPVVIQGASDDAIIYRVYRDQDQGRTKISDPHYRKDLDHLMMNTLLTSPLFGLEDSRLDENNANAHTDDSYLLYKINNQLKKRLETQRLEGKNFVSDSEIDDLITRIMDEESAHD